MVSLASPAGAMPPPTTPTSLRLKRPTLALKRDSSFLDTDDEAGLSASTKKLKVAFDPNVDVRILDDWSDKSFDLVKEEVRQAIERHTAPESQRDDTQYAKLLKSLSYEARSSDALSPKLLKKYVLAIDGWTSSLGQCGQLAIAVLDLAWTGRDESFVGLYIRFLCDLASAHPKFVPSIMERLAAHFARLPASLGRLPEETPVSRARMFTRLHLAIHTLLRQIPSAGNAILRMLKQEFPNDLSTSKAYVQYQKHLLRLADEIPELKSEILALVVQRLVSLDIQVQDDIQNVEDDVESKLLQPEGSRDKVIEYSDDSDEDSDSESEYTETEDIIRLKELRLKVQKMDSTLDLLFEYYTPLIEDGSTAETNAAYQQLLSHFTEFILPNRCRHAQFLIFHFSQSSPSYTSQFASRCLEIAFNNTALSTSRFSACSYLASFIARGTSIPATSVREVTLTLCQYLETLRRRYEPMAQAPDRRAYSLYYAIAQAIIYIFLFRWRDLITGTTSPDLDSEEEFNEDDAIADKRQFTWQPLLQDTLMRNIQSTKLNPLKVLSSDIVKEFARIANHVGFLYIYDIIERNKRVRLGTTFSYYGNGGAVDVGRRETAMDRKKGEAHFHLEPYFPFDPYHLPRSKKWVENEYNIWKLPRGLRDDDDDAEEYEVEEESDVDESDAESLADEAEDLPVGQVAAVSV